ncbi:AAA family ATPase [Deinococcus sp. VB343]|uniref:AAA family ATPase n=1 Tax=Deinococcus sp. VB343 TaxID=3385567 RepID=UPI0039C9BCA0
MKRVAEIRSSDKCRVLTFDDIFLPSHEGSGKNRIDYLHVQDLLSFGKSTDFYFGNLNVLIGPNGTGKSNLIDCLKVAQSLPFDISENFKDTSLEDWIYKGESDGLQQPSLSISIVNQEFGPILHQISFIGSRYNKVFIEEIITDDGGNNSEPYFISSAENEPMITYIGARGQKRQREFPAREYNTSQSILNQVRDSTQYPEITAITQFYSSMRFYSEWTFGRKSVLRNPSSLSNSEDYLNESMDNLALVLDSLRGSSSHEKIRAYLIDLKDSYRDYSTSARFSQMILEIVEGGLSSKIPAHRLSDGTLRFLALASILLNTNLPSVICLEEPELGMHPDMIRMVSRMIVEASKNTQLIVTTHSELLLTALQDDIDQIFVFSSGPDGTSVRSFQKEDFKEWIADHSLGELWSTGELGGNRW